MQGNSSTDLYTNILLILWIAIRQARFLMEQNAYVSFFWILWVWINQRDTRKEKYRAEWTCNRPRMDINTGPPTLDANRPIDSQLMNKVYGIYTWKMLLLEFNDNSA